MTEEAIQRLEARLQAQDAKIQALETWRNEQRTDTAVRVERDRHMDQRFDKLEAGVNELKGYLLKIVWVIILGIVGAFITFVINGGLIATP